MDAIFPTSEQNAGLRQWLEELGGRPVSNIEKVKGGGFRISSRVTFAGEDAPRLFLKTDTGSAPKTPFNLKREHEVLAALDGRVLAPRALGYHEGLATMAMECLSGEADYGLAEDKARPALEEALVAALADVHRLDVASMRLAHLPPGLTISEAVQTDVGLWRSVLEGAVPDPHPVVLLAFAWLLARVPKDERRSALVNGDAGQGNFLFQGTRITGLLDWEVAHVGHPLEDIGCLLARSLPQPPLASIDRIMALYRQASGVEWTQDELLYATVLVMARFAVPISMSLVTRDPRMDFGLTMAYFHLSLISILSLIAQAEGFALDEDVPAAGTVPPAAFEYDYLTYLFGEIVAPDLQSDYARYRLQAGIGVIGYLREREKAAPARVPAAPFHTIAEAQEIVAGPRADLQRTMQRFLDDALYTEHLMRDLLGPLFGRRVRLPAGGNL